jgi:chromosome segregation ATPase
LKQKARELEESLSLKDRLFAANVTIEHLKGRIESLRKAANDREQEFAVQMDQYQTHMKDLTSRLEFSKDSATVSALKSQHAETEERCAMLAAQAIDEKERAAQERSMVAVVVRDVQARNTELETRCRGLESDLANLRQAARKSLELQREVGADRDRLANELQTALNQIAEIKKRANESEANFISREGELRSIINNKARDHEAERDCLISQITAANNRVAELDSLRASDAERLRTLQRQVTSATDSVRTELSSEVDAVRRSLLASQDECQRAKWRLAQLEQQLETTRRTLRDAESKLAAETERNSSLQTKVESAAGTEAWLTAEKDRLSDLCHRTELRVEELSKALNQAEETRLEAQRLRVQLQYAQMETKEAREESDRAATNARRAQEAFTARLKVMQREQKEEKKVFVSALKKQKKDKEKLLLAILEREQEEASTATMTTLRQSATVPATTDGVVFGGAVSTSRSPNNNNSRRTGGFLTTTVSPNFFYNTSKADPVAILKQGQSAVSDYQARIDALLGGR